MPQHTSVILLAAAIARGPITAIDENEEQGEHETFLDIAACRRDDTRLGGTGRSRETDKPDKPPPDEPLVGLTCDEARADGVDFVDGTWNDEETVFTV